MARTTGDIVIDAPPSRIMDVIADLEAYPDWATGVTAAEVQSTSAGGRPDRVRMTLNSPPILDTYTLAYVWHSPTRVTWSMAETGSVLTQVDGAYTLEPLATGTRVVYQLEVDVLIPLLGKLKRKAEKVIIDTALAGLKKHVEGA